MIRILLVDDQPAVRQGLKMQLALDPDVDVVGEAGDGAAALTQAAALQPDIVVMDIEMPHMDGMAATSQLREVAPDSAVVVLSLYDDAAMRTKALEAGAVSFVGKCEADEALPAAIRRAVQR